MAEAILDVVNSSELRQSLAKSGYEYVKRHGWDQKKKEYLDLIDSLSTEIFADVEGGNLRPVLGSMSADMTHDGDRQQSPNPVTREVSTLAVRFPSRSSLKKT